MRRRRPNDVRAIDAHAPVLAWCFAPPDAKPKPGRTFTLKRKADPGGRSPEAELRLDLLGRGFVAFESASDALLDARGPFAKRLALSGAALVEGGKRPCVRAERAACVAGEDATAPLHRLAVAWAERALERAGDRDRRPAEALRGVSRWLDGSLVFERLEAARQAAWDASREADPSGPLGAIHRASWRGLPIPPGASGPAAIAAARWAAVGALVPEAHLAARLAAERAVFAAGVFAAAHGAEPSAAFYGACDYERGAIDRELDEALRALLGAG